MKRTIAVAQRHASVAQTEQIHLPVAIEIGRMDLGIAIRASRKRDTAYRARGTEFSGPGPQSNTDSVEVRTIACVGCHIREVDDAIPVVVTKHSSSHNVPVRPWGCQDMSRKICHRIVGSLETPRTVIDEYLWCRKHLGAEIVCQDDVQIAISVDIHWAIATCQVSCKVKNFGA